MNIKFHRALGLLTVIDVCGLLGITRKQYDKAVRRGLWGGPSHRIGENPRLYFSRADLEAMRRILEALR